MKDAGIGLIGLGLLAILIGFLVKVGRSVGYPVGEIANFHAMHVQALVFQAGFVAFLSGVILFAGGSINESIRTKSGNEAVPDAVEAPPPEESESVEPISNWTYAVVVGGLILMVVLGLIAATKSGSSASSPSADVATNMPLDLSAPMMDENTLADYPAGLNDVAPAR